MVVSVVSTVVEVGGAVVDGDCVVLGVGAVVGAVAGMLSLGPTVTAAGPPKALEANQPAATRRVTAAATTT
jgi:hypothetical protein